ncbi:pyridoxal phosphate-dependent transferase [Plectosphaerella plurivora]|uniref:Pyridoxal phosphate-dependent transferase n=1 Tax=Plectosphaerella plurivora TaxID=936078 RepID=A0A9P9A6F0_9PEZI|nr:pyridoxal phosphate-dependent transferase [Plectosphaerella plurivora]
MQLQFPPSNRALAALDQGPAWDLMQRVKALPTYDPSTPPDGLINLSGALNHLMTDWTAAYLARHAAVPEPIHLEYGPLAGSSALLSAAAAFLNRFFQPLTPVEPTHLLAANGVTSLIDLAAWALCDPGDAVLYPTPNFYMLDCDLKTRAAVETVAFSTSSLTDPFQDAEGLIALAEAAANEALSRNLRCKFLFICNPVNPQGRCYSRATLVALAVWCTRRGMHVVVDEIYALSRFHSSVPSAFTSILSIAGGDVCQENIHCLYGLSKDFNMCGLRVAFLITRNAAIREAASRATWFTWLTAFSDAFAARFLGDLDNVQDFLRTYRQRLAAQYHKTTVALRRCGIPFQPAEAGLFVYIDLGRWIHHFQGTARQSSPRLSPELLLCEWLIMKGVFLNAGEFGGSDRPGCFRLVFTEEPDATVLAVERIRRALDRLDQGALDTRGPVRTTAA